MILSKMTHFHQKVMIFTKIGHFLKKGPNFQKNIIFGDRFVNFSVGEIRETHQRWPKKGWGVPTPQKKCLALCT